MNSIAGTDCMQTSDEVLSEAVDRVRSSVVPRAFMQLPEDVGIGSYTQMHLRGGVGISFVNMAFIRPVAFCGATPSEDQYCLMFCLGGSMQWHCLSNGSEYAVEEEQSCFMDAGKASGKSLFPEGSGLNNFGVTMPGSFFRELLCSPSDKNAGQRVCAVLHKERRLRMGKTDSRHKRIIHDFLSCRLCGAVRHVFLESKVLELMAIYLDEFFFENTEVGTAQNMDHRAMESLRKAKDILDADIANAPTLAFLARKVGLNEYKLKTGFKKMFGMPVHAYIIDRRLEEARMLLETKGLRVTEAAQMVGYSELGQFAGKFRRKFGVTPSELLRTL